MPHGQGSYIHSSYADIFGSKRKGFERHLPELIQIQPTMSERKPWLIYQVQQGLAATPKVLLQPWCGWTLNSNMVEFSRCGGKHFTQAKTQVSKNVPDEQELLLGEISPRLCQQDNL